MILILIIREYQPTCPELGGHGEETLANMMVTYYSVKFSGSSTTTITAPMECDTDDAGETLCVTASGTSWSAPISGVKWS